MLFEIDSSVPRHLASDSAVSQDFESVNLLALGVSEGKHRIIGGRSVLRELVEGPGLNKTTRSVFERAACRIPREMNLLQKVAVYGKVIGGTGATPAAKTVGIQRVITFPLRWFDESDKVQRVTLLGENLLDTRVFKKFAEVGPILAGWDRRPVEMARDHGGGSTTVRVLEDHSTSNRLCLCIVDSDRACPGGDCGDTATSVQKFNSYADYPLMEVLEIGARDLENLLPNAFYKIAYGEDDALAVVLEGLTEQGEHEVRAHLDIKMGVMGRQIFAEHSGSPEGKFWKSKQSILLAHCDSQLPCLSIGACKPIIGKNCHCVVIAGKGSRILERFLEHFEDWDGHGLKGILDDSVRSEWLRLGVSIASWCCGDDRLRA